MASYVAFISGIVKFSSPSFSWALVEKKCFHFFLLSYHCFTKHLQFSFETLHDGGDSFSILCEFLGAYLCLWCSSFLQQNLLERCPSLVDFSSFFFSCSIDSLPIHFVVEFFSDELFSQGWCGEEPGYLHYFMETPHKTGVCDWGCWSIMLGLRTHKLSFPIFRVVVIKVTWGKMNVLWWLLCTWSQDPVTPQCWHSQWGCTSGRSFQQVPPKRAWPISGWVQSSQPVCRWARNSLYGPIRVLGGSSLGSTSPAESTDLPSSGLSLDLREPRLCLLSRRWLRNPRHVISSALWLEKQHLQNLLFIKCNQYLI